jgi:hypothetical protein
MQSSRKIKWLKSCHEFSKLDGFLGVKLVGLFWVSGVLDEWTRP